MGMLALSNDCSPIVESYYRNIWILELSEVLTTKKEDGNIHDRYARSVYLKAAFVSLAVDVGEGVYLRVAIIQGRGKYGNCT